MQKLSLGLLVTGVLGQLSALLWVYTSTGPTCENNVDNSYIQQKVTDFEHEFDDIANKVATEISTNLPDELTPLAKNESRTPDSTEADAVQASNTSGTPRPRLRHQPITADSPLSLQEPDLQSTERKKSAVQLFFGRSKICSGVPDS